jgi:hypothetical protein
LKHNASQPSHSAAPTNGSATMKLWDTRPEAPFLCPRLCTTTIGFFAQSRDRPVHWQVPIQASFPSARYLFSTLDRVLKLSKLSGQSDPFLHGQIPPIREFLLASLLVGSPPLLKPEHLHSPQPSSHYMVSPWIICSASAKINSRRILVRSRYQDLNYDASSSYGKLERAVAVSSISTRIPKDQATCHGSDNGFDARLRFNQGP